MLVPRTSYSHCSISRLELPHRSFRLTYLARLSSHVWSIVVGEESPPAVEASLVDSPPASCPRHNLQTALEQRNIVSTGTA